MPSKPITLAVITGAHGVTGEVRVKLFGEGVESLRRFRVFTDGTLTPSKLRDDGKGGAIACFAEITDRNAAEALRGVALTVPRDALPPLAEGEYYHSDLIGLRCISDNALEVGVVIAVNNFGAGDIIEIRKSDGKTFMVPMTVQAVPEWDDSRLIVSSGWVDP